MEKMFSDLQKLIGINSVCERTDSTEYPFGENVRKALDASLEICEGYGFRVKNNQNMIGYAEVGQGEGLIGILVHLDIVPAGDGWNSDPFTVERRDGKLFGRGIIDDKGPAVAVIHALKELQEEGAAFKNRVRIIFGQAEESGDWDDMEFYKEHEEQITFGFTPDADFPAIYGEKGIAHLRFLFPKNETCFDMIKGGTAVNMVPDGCVAKGMKHGEKFSLKITGKSAHGSTPENGENAISKMMMELDDVENCKLVEFFRQFIKMEYNGESLGGYFADEESGPITYNIGMIESNEENIEILVDVRYPITCKIDEILGAIEQNLEAKGFGGFKPELLADTPYVHMDKNGEVIQTLVGAYREHTGDNSEPTLIGGGTYARAMDHIVAFGPMLPGRELTEHQANEYIYESDFLLAKEIYKTAIRKLAIKE